jgi:zinc transport system substrate-binding protein
MVFHPAFSYYAQQYGLEQWAIEVDGKEPSGRQLAQLINRVKEKQVKWIIVEKQFDQSSARTIAESINADILELDPLAEDYLENMQIITRRIKTALF